MPPLRALRLPLTAGVAAVGVALTDMFAGGPTPLTWLALAAAGLIVLGVLIVASLPRHVRERVLLEESAGKRGWAQTAVVGAVAVALGAAGVSVAIFWAAVAPLLVAIVVWEVTIQMRHRRRAG
jgi:putative Mn2+ efflux pump MntP